MFGHTDVMSVIGGGWSFQYVDPAKVPGAIIAVNEAAVLLDRQLHAAVSMDRLWAESRWERLKAIKPRTWLRRSATQNIDWLSEKWVRVFDCDHTTVEFSEDPATLNGTNSGACALNLAYLCRPKELYLFGFDMCRHPNGDAYWHKPYEWAPKGATKPMKYEEWAAQFNRMALAFASISCRVINVSEASQIRCWTKLSPKQLGMAK